jgi:probable rRNA maturation factor
MPLLVSISYKDVDVHQKIKIERTLEKVCLKISYSLHILKKLYFDTIITNPKEMRYINSSYRKIDKPTDVLSFALHDVEPQTNLLGEIYIN